MRDLEAELKSLKLFGMASAYAEVASQGGAKLQSSEWLLWQLLHAEIEDQHIRSIRYQLQSARFPVHRKRPAVPPVKNIRPTASCDFLNRSRYGHHIEMASAY
ncbi:ATP-binding protein [Methylomonas rapida]|uniref:ATP-binding protein n=1 Tax=Methylomonas rapida TaxID=2963939 RepID=A0ABY7GP75_9GAMM|nr:ATP-binding protein [Methylomonas rapida]WAR46300.1 ATP-binding protein [Methylomonas rapida]